jgi:hypothetical protein
MNLLELFEPPVGQHHILNPKLWEARGTLRGEVHGALLRIAEDFIDFVDIDLDIKDIVITGGNANYTYTSHSDIDLHIIADLSKVKCDREIHELLDTKRLLYRKTRNINIHKIPVELYVEDVDLPAVTAGCYSILNKEWTNKPQLPLVADYNEKQVKEKVDHWHTVIDHATKTKNVKAAQQAMALIRYYRRLGLKTARGEFSIPNLVFKSLRNDESIGKLQQLLDLAHDQHLSI